MGNEKLRRQTESVLKVGKLLFSHPHTHARNQRTLEVISLELSSHKSHILCTHCNPIGYTCGWLSSREHIMKMLKRHLMINFPLLPLSSSKTLIKPHSCLRVESAKEESVITANINSIRSFDVQIKHHKSI